MTNRPPLFSRIALSIIITSDGLSSLFIGLLAFVIVGLGDPIASEMYHKAREVQVVEAVAWLSFAYLLFCILALRLWSKGKSNWAFVLIGIALSHLLVSIIGFGILTTIFFSSGRFLKILFYMSMLLDFLVAGFLILSKIKNSRFLMKKKAA